MGTNAVSPTTGGNITLPCWRPDIGAVPARALVRIPGVFDDFRVATILPDGTVRCRLNRSDLKDVSSGEHEAEWKLSFYVTGNTLNEDDEPPTEDWEAYSYFDVTEDPARLAADADWFDADGLPTPAYLREKQMFGLPIFDVTGRLMTDAAMASQIAAAVQRVENNLGVALRKRVVSSIAEFQPDADPDTGLAPEVTPEPAYDYNPTLMRTGYGFFRLRTIPVKRILHLEMHLSNQKVTEIPGKWLKVNGKAGDVQLVPGALSALTLPGLALPIVSGAYGDRQVPHLWHVAYEAGGMVDASLRDVVAWIAAQVLLIVASDSVTAGLASQSISIDGISQSVTTTNSSTNSTYGANITELEKRIKKWFDEQAPSYRGVRIVVA